MEKEKDKFTWKDGDVEVIMPDDPDYDKYDKPENNEKENKEE